MRSHVFAVWFAAVFLAANLWLCPLASIPVAAVGTVVILCGAVAAAGLRPREHP